MSTRNLAFMGHKTVIKALLSVFLLIPTFLQAQNLQPLLELVSEKDRKDTEKALEKLSEAGELTKEANDTYNEALALQSNYELDEKTLQKELSKTEDKALKLQIKADKLYAEAYQSLHEICKKTLAEASVSYGETGNLESDADDMMEQAVQKRAAAENAINTYEKAALLNEAASLEGAAIDNLQQALQLQQGVTPMTQETETYDTDEDLYEPYTPPETDYVTPTETYDYSSSVVQKSENLAVDQNKIDQYNEYVSDNSIPEPILVNRDGVSGVDDVSVEGARQVFQQAHSPEYTPYEETARYETPETTAEDTISTPEDVTETWAYAQEQEYETEEPDTYTQQHTDEYDNRETETGYQQQQQEYKAYKPEDDSRMALDISSTQQVEGVSFVVQVAASRIPLTRSQLYAIYSGRKTVQQVEEGGWYKYRITGFRLFSDANRVAVQSGVKDAYVIAELNNSQLPLPEAKSMTRVLEKNVNSYGRNQIKNGVEYYVQVAASRIRFSENDLMQYCGGEGICREIIEEGWYKYQVYAGNSYAEAQNLKNRVGGDAFIVAYELGTKIELYKAINKTK